MNVPSKHVLIILITYFPTIVPVISCVFFPVGLSSFMRHLQQVLQFLLSPSLSSFDLEILKAASSKHLHNDVIAGQNDPIYKLLPTSVVRTQDNSPDQANTYSTMSCDDIVEWVFGGGSFWCFNLFKCVYFSMVVFEVYYGHGFFYCFRFMSFVRDMFREYQMGRRWKIKVNNSN